VLKGGSLCHRLSQPAHDANNHTTHHSSSQSLPSIDGQFHIKKAHFIMYLIAIAWMYVVLMMAVAEGLSPVGSWLGAFFTLLLYGVAPLSIVLYILGTRLRRQRRAAEEARMTATATVRTPTSGPDPPNAQSAEPPAS
jgi:hypothetical protein